MAVACKQSASLTRASYGSSKSAFSGRIPTRSVERRQLRVKATLEPTTVIAVTQQAVAYAVCLGAEGVYTRTQMAEDAPGRPSIIPIAAGVAGTVAAVALVSSGTADTTGLAIGLAASTALFAYNIKRLLDTKHDAQYWPGPKAWPAGMALVSFFALNVFLQGLRSDLTF